MTLAEWMLKIATVAMTIVVVDLAEAWATPPSESVPLAALPIGASLGMDDCCEEFPATECQQLMGKWDDPCSSDTWRVSAEALFLYRRAPSATALVVSSDQAEILNARDFDLDVHAGFDLSLARQLGERLSMELRYFGVDHWRAQSTAPTTPGSSLQVNASPPVFVTAGDAIEALYTSELHSAEINGRYCLSERWTLLAGFRYVELDERFGAELVDANSPFRYEAASRNRLYGGQLGAAAMLWDCGGPLRIEAIGKAGAFGNAASQHSFYTTDVVSLSADDAQSPFSFLGEIGIVGNYQLSRRWSATVGYQLLWINQVALATEQLASTDFVFGSGIDASGDTFYHGATVGLQYVR